MICVYVVEMKVYDQFEPWNVSATTAARMTVDGLDLDQIFSSAIVKEEGLPPILLFL